MPKSYEDLVRMINVLNSLPEVHIDVMDGKFVKATSWPYTNNNDVTIAYDLLKPFSLEVDLMVEQPLIAAESWLKAGADQLVFHIETIEPQVLENFVHTHSVTVGVALNNSTPLEELYPYLSFADYVQVMGITTIGLQGQPFDMRVIGRIKTLHANYPAIPISLDGSVNQDTLPTLTDLGISRFIVGSAIVKAINPKESYLALSAMVKS
jgi:ribulose-phosphate 3-epimerase